MLKANLQWHAREAGDMRIGLAGPLQEQDHGGEGTVYRQGRSMPHTGVQDGALAAADAEDLEALQSWRAIGFLRLVRRAHIDKAIPAQRDYDFGALHVALGPIDA